MKAPTSEPYPGALQDLFDTSNQFVMIETLTITLVDGTILTYTSGETGLNGFLLGPEDEADLQP